LKQKIKIGLNEIVRLVLLLRRRKRRRRARQNGDPSAVAIRRDHGKRRKCIAPSISGGRTAETLDFAGRRRHGCNLKTSG